MLRCSILLRKCKIMKTRSLLGAILFIMVCLFLSCSNNKNSQTNGEESVKIGSQIWMAKNLDIVTFRNGDSIPEAKSIGEWNSSSVAQEPAWCYYENETSHGKKYGKLYNYYAVKDPRGLAPKGWHIPTKNEWLVLTHFLGGSEKAGAKIKSRNGWKDDGNGTNSSYFNGLPGGARYMAGGGFKTLGEHANWWSATADSANSNEGLMYEVGAYSSALNSQEIGMGCGFSVRCIKD